MFESTMAWVTLVFIYIFQAQQGGKKIGLKEAIKMWEEKTGNKAAEAAHIKLNGWHPPIEKMDGSTSLLTKCELVIKDYQTHNLKFLLAFFRTR